MVKRSVDVLVLVLLAVTTSAAQDAKTVIANASKAMGADNLTSITYYGSGANFNLGQYNNANGPWPRTNADDYVALDRLHAAGVARDRARSPRPVTGGPRRSGPVPAEHHAGQYGLGAAAGNLGHPVGISQRRGGEQRHRADRRRSGGSATRRDLERAAQVAGRPALPGRRLHQRPEPGGEGRDLAGESRSSATCWSNRLQRLSRRQRREVSGGDRAEARRAGRRSKRRSWAPTPNPANIQQLLTPPPPPAAAGRAARRAQPLTAASEKLAEGVYRISGGLQRAGRRVRRSHPALRAGPAERSARAGDHRRSQAGHSEQADPLRRHLAPSLRSHQRLRRAGRRRHHHRHARDQQGVLRAGAARAAHAGAGRDVEVGQEAGIEGWSATNGCSPTARGRSRCT